MKSIVFDAFFPACEAPNFRTTPPRTKKIILGATP